jgi:hypothetical protein
MYQEDKNLDSKSLFEKYDLTKSFKIFKKKFLIKKVFHVLNLIYLLKFYFNTKPNKHLTNKPKSNKTLKHQYTHTKS